MTRAFDDLIAANARFADSARPSGADGVAQAGVAVVTCMDARIDPLALLGLRTGDATVMRNPGGRVDDATSRGLVLAVTLLGVDRVLVVVHTRCAVAGTNETELSEQVGRISGRDPSGQVFGAVADQEATLHEDVARVRAHPLIPDRVAVGGFRYDVDSGRLQQLG